MVDEEKLRRGSGGATKGREFARARGGGGRGGRAAEVGARYSLLDVVAAVNALHASLEPQTAENRCAGTN